MDYNATSIMYESVKDAMANILSLPLNPSSIHSFGRDARAMVENARSKILSLLGANNSYDLTFVSSGTEANNLIIHNFRNSKILVSATEHLSIIEHKKFNDNIDILPVDRDGIIDINFLENWLKSNPKSLVSIMLANNETGVISNLSNIAKLVHQYDSFLHSDIAQAPSKMAVDISSLDLDFATISAHKFGGPVGAAALIYRSKFHLHPQIIGGGQEKGVRSGTQNVASIVGFAIALEESVDLSCNNKMIELRNLLEEELIKLDNNIIIFGKNSNRLPNTSMFSQVNTDAREKIILLDINNIAVSNGSACSSGKVKSSHVLEAMGFSTNEISGAIRVSLGKDNSKEDIYRFIDIWKKGYE